MIGAFVWEEFGHTQTHTHTQTDSRIIYNRSHEECYVKVSELQVERCGYIRKEIQKRGNNSEITCKKKDNHMKNVMPKFQSCRWNGVATIVKRYTHRYKNPVKLR